MNKITACLLVCATFGVFTGCQSQQDNQKKTGSYTAARRNMIGSHIPQPYSADSTNATLDQQDFMSNQQRSNNVSSAIGSSATGGR